MNHEVPAKKKNLRELKSNQNLPLRALSKDKHDWR